MFIINAKKILICNENFEILSDTAFVFDEVILEFGKFENLSRKFPQAKIIKTPPNSLILPAFINPHTHLEFSANSGTLHYGNFITWLKSVMSSRDSLSEAAREELILQNIQKMLKTGTGTIGEISSFGIDLKPCLKACEKGVRVIFFNEILGASQAQISAKKTDFLKRFKLSLNAPKNLLENELFIPAISIHSPYSTHPNLAKFALDLAHEKNLLVSTHFLESKDENLWLRKQNGKFKEWLSTFNENPAPLYSISKFITLFNGIRTLFTHCVFLKEFELLDKNLHSITHCAFSNFLLSEATFKLKKALKSGLNIHLGTDGLSSNISLSMLDEMRANLLIHKDFASLKLAKILLKMTTLNPARALGLNSGSLEKGKSADFSVFKINEINDEQLALQFILNSREVEKIFIKGKECKF